MVLKLRYPPHEWRTSRASQGARQGWGYKRSCDTERPKVVLVVLVLVVVLVVVVVVVVVLVLVLVLVLVK